MINVRTLFTKYHVQYIDRGKNTSRGNVNIQCAFCGNADRSFHLAVNETTGYYYCFRNQRHKGLNITTLLKKLNIPPSEYRGLKLEEEDQTTFEDKRDYSAWNYFEPAEESQEALDYLESRLFSDPIGVCRQFNLKVSKEGEWAGRLLIPLYPVGWTGRAMREHLTLRYDAHTNEGGYYLFKQRSSSCILQEGAIDCMRIASVSSQFDVIGKCRMALSLAILTYLRDANYSSIFVAPDNTVSYSEARAERNLIRSYCTTAEVTNFTPPKPNKDFGATSESDTRRLLTTLGAERMVKL